ncbi:flagellin N-terminal helical domain-containing protein [Dyella sp.]|uniref:flagellin N-terminal helical domain-containing protein n=1 Tax=Dyella sp. TaxID=1869338 RepID=UPI003F7D81AC
MSLVINTNVSSLNTQNNLSKSQSALAQATQRLSSGLKINSAADNAAGFAISQRYTTQIGGLAQASANASDAINLAQTTGSALDQVTANLQAIRDLAAQSANGTYSDADRKTIDNEVQQRLQEVTRIANQTTFNGKKVLDGSLQSQSFQIGANVGQTVSVSLGQSVKASDLGAVAEVKTGDISGKIGPQGAKVVGSANTATDFSGTNDVKFTVDGNTVTLNSDLTDADGVASAIQTQLNSAAAGKYTVTNNAGKLTIATTATGASAAAPVIADAGGTANVSTVLGAAPVSSAGVDNTDLSGEGLTVNGKAVDLTGAKSLQDVSDAINAAGVDGVSAAVSADGKGINFYSNSALTLTDTGGNIVGANAKDVNANATYTAGTAAATGGSLAGGTVGTVDGANDLISRIDVALSSVADFAAQLGAVQNRFQSTISTLSSQSTNLKASQSTIQDADFAAETANLSKAQVLQQAGISVLSQANSNPQQVLKLLQ